MNSYKANLINAIVLVAVGLWGYLASETPSVTALIPVAFGGVFLLLSQGIKKDNKVIAHVIVVLTLVIIIALFKPLFGAIGRNDMQGISRVGLMILTSIFAMIYFIKSFIDARKSRS